MNWKRCRTKLSGHIFK